MVCRSKPKRAHAAILSPENLTVTVSAFHPSCPAAISILAGKLLVYPNKFTLLFSHYPSASFHLRPAAISIVAGKMLVYPNEFTLPLMPNFGLPPPPRGMLHIKVRVRFICLPCCAGFLVLGQCVRAASIAAATAPGCALHVKMAAAAALSEGLGSQQGWVGGGEQRGAAVARPHRQLGPNSPAGGHLPTYKRMAYSREMSIGGHPNLLTSLASPKHQPAYARRWSSAPA